MCSVFIKNNHTIVYNFSQNITKSIKQYFRKKKIKVNFIS